MESFEHKVNDFLEILNHQNVSSGIDDELLDLSHGMLQSRFDDITDDDEALEMTGKIDFLFQSSRIFDEMCHDPTYQ